MLLRHKTKNWMNLRKNFLMTSKKFIDECQKRVLVFDNGFQNSPSNETERTDHNNQVANFFRRLKKCQTRRWMYIRTQSLKSRTKLDKLSIFLFPWTPPSEELENRYQALNFCMMITGYQRNNKNKNYNNNYEWI